MNRPTDICCIAALGTLVLFYVCTMQPTGAQESATRQQESVPQPVVGSTPHRHNAGLFSRKAPATPVTPSNIPPTVPLKLTPLLTPEPQAPSPPGVSPAPLKMAAPPAMPAAVPVPINAVPTKPIPVKRIEPVKHIEPAERVEPAKRVAPSKHVAPMKHVVPAKRAKSSRRSSVMPMKTVPSMAPAGGVPTPSAPTAPIMPLLRGIPQTVMPGVHAVGAPGVTNTAASGVYAYLNQGAALNAQGQYNEAAQAYSSAIGMDPNLVAAYQGRALCYYQLGRYQESLNDCDAAIRLDPNCANAYGMRGTDYYRLQRFNEALADHTKAMELNGGKSNATANDLLSQAVDQYVFRQYQDAISSASLAIAKDPNNDRAYDIRGLAHSEANDFSAAMDDFNKAISMSPDNPDYWGHRGVTEIKLGKLDAAMADLTYAVQRRPDFGIAWYDRGIAHMLQGDYADGLKDIQEAIRTDHRFSLGRYEFKQDRAKGKRPAQLPTPEDYYYRACTRILTVKNETALSDLRHYLSKTKWQGILASDAVLAIYLGEMRNHHPGSAQNILKSGEARCNKSEWPYPVISCLQNKIPVNDLLAQATTNYQLTDVHAYVGSSEVLSGVNTATTNPHLEWVKQNGSPSLVSYDLAIQQIEKETFTGPKGHEVPLP